MGAIKNGATRPVRGWLGIVIAMPLLWLAAPAPASADTYCVHQPADPCAAGEIDKGTNLQAALDDAAASSVDDEVVVGAGTYSGPFEYLATTSAVEISGAGDATVLEAPSGDSVIVLAVADDASTVRNVRINVPNGNNNLGLHTIGTADGVNVVLPSNPTGNVTGVQMGLAGGGGTFRRGAVTGPFVESPNVRAIAASTGGPVLIEDATLQAQDAIRVSGAATIRRVDVTAVNGFNLQSDDPAGGSFLIEDSVWRTPPGAAEGRGLLGVCGATADAELTARNLTLVDGASGPGFHPAVASICNAPGRSTSMTLHSSIALDPENAVVAIATSGTSTLAVSYSNFDPAKAHELGFGPSEIAQGPGNVNVAPGFAGVEDFALLPGSPLVDAGDPAGLVAGESTTDLAGAPRITDGNGDGVARRDIGAHELPPQPPAVTQPPPPRPTVNCRGAALPRTDGTDGGNNIVGSAAADAIFGFGGKDEIDGADGNDCLNGGGGNDLLRGGAAKDVVKGGAGVDKVRGQGGKDKLRGNGGKDRLNGGEGKDKLSGGPGNDKLRGGAAKDTLKGNGGADKINAVDAKRDKVNCGGGDDKAVVDPVDRAARNCETVREVEKE